MKTEEILFNVYSEFAIFAELYEKLDQDQVVTFMENVTASFSELDPDALNRYKAYLKHEIERERARGAMERTTVLENLSEEFEY
jgi:hypothetical protein